MCCFNSSLLPGWLPRLESNGLSSHRKNTEANTPAIKRLWRWLQVFLPSAGMKASVAPPCSQRAPIGNQITQGFWQPWKLGNAPQQLPAYHDRLKPSFRGQSASNQRRAQGIHIPQLDQDKCLLAVKLTMFPLLPPEYEKQVTSH